MANLRIKDLPENVDLDWQAMAAIAGGARARGGRPLLARTIFGGSRTLSDPARCNCSAIVDDRGRAAANAARE